MITSPDIRKAYRKISKDKSRLKYRYGITPNEYMLMLESQAYKCSICNKEESMINKKTNLPFRLSVDHDHYSGKVRSLLCRNCNSGLGKFKDMVKIIENALAYLKKHKEVL